MATYICINGKIVSKHESSISPFDHGYLYGAGLFETIRVYRNHPFLLDDHLKRLNLGLQMIGIRTTYSRADWLKLIKDLLDANELSSAYVRLNVSAGTHELGLSPSVYTQPTYILFCKPLSEAEMFPDKCGIFLKTRRNTPETVVRLKSHHFLNNLMAKQEIGSSTQMEGIFLTAQGHISEGIVSNLFWIKSGTVYTPSLRTGILNGITRRFILELLKKRGIPFQIGFYERSHLLSADEAFLTNSIQEIVPFKQIEERHFPGNKGEITRKLQNDYRFYRNELWSSQQLFRKG